MRGLRLKIAAIIIASVVAVVLVASARDVAGGASTDRVPCGSTGMLEKQMLETIRGYLPAG